MRKRLFAYNICDKLFSYLAMLLYVICFLCLIALFNVPYTVKNLVIVQEFV